MIARSSGKWVTVSSNQLMACCNTKCIFKVLVMKYCFLRPSFQVTEDRTHFSDSHVINTVFSVPLQCCLFKVLSNEEFYYRK
jgi:hypothetical protein